MMEVSIPVESLITGNFVKYERLGPLVAKAYAGSNATHINIFIDMYPIAKSLYSQPEIKTENPYSITSIIFNMCAHYRDYFRKYLGVSSTIYIMFSNNCPIMSGKYIGGYNKGFINNALNNTTVATLIRDNLELISTMAPYLPDIHFIIAEYETTAMIKAMITKLRNNGDTNPNMVISRDIMPIQLLADETTSYLRPKKSKGTDTSILLGPILGQPDRMQEMWNYYNESRENKPDDILIHPCNLALVMSLAGLKERSIKRYISLRQAKKFIQTAVGYEPIKCSTQTLFDCNPEIFEMVPKVLLDSRVKAFDMQFQEALYSDSVEFKLLNLVNLEDPISVKRINDKYLYNCPIDLDRL